MSLLQGSQDRNRRVNAFTIFLTMIKSYTNLPLGVGFGVKTREDIHNVYKAESDAVIVGSAIVGMIQKIRLYRF